MHRPRFSFVCLVLLAAPASCVQRETARSPAQPAEPSAGTWQAERTYPPLVFSSSATLDCSISATAEGRQVMTTVSGQGFTFSTAMRPLAKSELALQGKGMMYKFDAYPVHAFPARFSGLGEGTITAMKAEVEVQVDAFVQPGGPGTAISFAAEDITRDAAYVEFTGIWVRARDGKRFPFRVLFSSVTSGSGKVVPRTSTPASAIVSKMVTLGTPPVPATVTTSLYEVEDEVAELPPAPAPGG